MTRIIKGVFDFQKLVHSTQENLFKTLGAGQKPQALFITCSDSRISPDMLTQTKPGELFIMRNAGNIVTPAKCDHPSAEAATMEYAIKQLQVRDLILCGHAKCGAVQGLLNLGQLDKLPHVRKWLTHAEPILDYLKTEAKGLTPEETLTIAIERNVIQQLENAKSYPFVKDAIASGQLRIHGWVYHFETGTVMAYDQSKSRFVSLNEASKPKFASNPEEVEAYLRDHQSALDMTI